MAVSFPRSVASLADRLKISSVRWILQEQQEFSGLGSGEFLVADLAPRFWKADVSFATMSNDDAADFQADIETLDGAINAFYLYDPRKMFPRSDPDGSILGASAVQIATLGANNKSLSLSGLPSGYVLSKGDLFHFDYGASPVRRALHRIVETVVAGEAGVSPVFEVRPHFLPGVAAGLAIKLVKPAAKMRIVPGSFDAGTGALGGITSGMSFQAMQTL